MRTLNWLCNAGLVSAALAACAQGSVITVSDTSSGWYTADSSDNYFNFGTENYLAGYCSSTDCGTGGEHRNFFTFSIPDLDGPVSSLVLTINTGGTSFTQSPTATYQVTSLPDTFGFNDLGTGTVYGTLAYSASSTDADESIVLNSSAIAAVSADSTFGVGGLVSDLPANPTGDQYLFGDDGIGTGDVELTITTTTLSDDPEPAALGLCGAGGIALALARQWRRRRASLGR